MIGHISGIPVEETILLAIPIAGAAYAALMASIRLHRRRLFRRK